MGARRLMLAGWALGLAGLSGVCPAATDEITLTSGANPVVRGEVKKESLEQVVAVGEGRVPLPTFRGDQVVSITWDIPNDEWRRALVEMNSGNYEQAAVSLHTLIEDLSTFREVARPYLFLKYAEALYRQGKATEAADEFEKLARDYPTSRYVPEALDRMVEIHLQTKNINKARAVLKRLGALGPAYAVKAVMYDAELDLALNHPDDADRKFEEAVRRGPDPETLALIRLGQARCAALAKQYDKAKQTAQQALASKSTSPAVAATAHLIIGTVLLQEAQAAASDPGKYLDAALEFLRISQVYPGDERTEPEALFKAGECFRLLAKLPDRKADQARAAELYTSLRGKYPGSRWAKQAQEVLKTLR